MKYSLGYITAPSKTEANKIVLELLENRLIACANVVSSTDSFYMWDNRVQHKKEWIIILKTRISNEERIINTVNKMHSYECPCIVFLPLTNGSKDFFWWIGGCC